MGYLGNEPTTGHFPVQTNLVGPGPTYTLDRAPASAGAIEVSVAGVLQPTTSYSVSGTTLTMAGVVSGIPIFIRYLGETLTLPTIADGVVTLAKIGADAVDGTKIADDAINSEHYTDGSIDAAHLSANSVDSDAYVDGSIDEAHIAADAVNFVTHLKAGTDGELITWDASGNPAAVPVGTSGHILTSGGTGVAPTFVAAAGGGGTRQIVEVSSKGYSAITSTSYANIPGVSKSITTTGGDVLVQVWCGGAINTAGRYGYLAIRKDSGSDDVELTAVNSAGGANDWSQGMNQNLYTSLSAGTYTFYGRWRISYASSWNNSNSYIGMVLMELS